jgi:tetratricopeptide (TPR) repeat protein
LTPFVYLPIRAKTGSFLNWGDPSTLENFLNHITGKQYRVWAFSSFEVMMRQISYYVSTLPENFGYFAILFALIGLVKILKFDKEISRFTLIAFITCLLISSNYDIHDIDAYFLVSHFILAVWIFHGMTHLPSRIPKPFVVAFGVVCIISTIGFNFKKVNKSENFLPENYTLNILNNLKRNAIVISYQWDYFVSPALYFQLVEGIRKDVVVIDKELLRRSWYIKQLEKNYPWLIQKSSEEVNAFLVELYKFEHNLPYDPMVIEEKFIKMINSFIDKNIEERPVYVGIEIEPEIGKKYNRVPEGFMFVLYKDGDYKDYNFAGFEVKGRIYNKYFDNLLNLIVKMILNRGIYEFKHGKRDKAKFYFEEALRIKPESVEAKLWLERAVKGG